MAKAQPPCPQDSCIDGGFPLGDHQWSTGTAGAFDECEPCSPTIQFDRFNTWSLLADTGNHVSVWGGFAPPCDTVRIRVMKDCNEVVKDICIMFPVTGAGCMYEFEAHSFLDDLQLLVSWRSANIDSIGVMALTVNDGDTLDSTLYLLDSCGMLGMIPWEPPQPESSSYYDKRTLQRVERPIPHVGYLKREDGE